MKRIIIRVCFWLLVVAAMVAYAVRSLRDAVPGREERTTYEQLKRSSDIRPYESGDFDRTEPAEEAVLRALYARIGDAGVFVETEESRKRRFSGILVRLDAQGRNCACELDGVRIELPTVSADTLQNLSAHAVWAGGRIVVFENQCGGSEVNAYSRQSERLWTYCDSHHSHCTGVVSEELGLVACYIFEARRSGWNSDKWESQVKYLDLKSGRVLGSASLPVNNLKAMGFVPGSNTLILDFDGFGRKLDLTPVAAKLKSMKQ